MGRDVCGICWCPYDDDTGRCVCANVKVINPAADEALLKQAREAINLLLEDLDECDCSEEARWCPRVRGEAALHLLNERLK
jgi:molybdopterin/thiamine biosynthesis adenylyltransferase